ncbi:MAG: chromosome segregation protein SMC, partial [Pseudomonadota bacterium]
KLEADLPAAETALSHAARDQDEASDARDRARDERQTTALALRALETEVGTLSRLLTAGRTGDTKPIIDQLDVADGYEAALAAALGDDLNASLESDASIHWSEPSSADPAPDDPPLPDGIACLTNFVTGDGARTIGRRLAFIGVVDAADGARLQNSLKPGQRLVSRDGDLWRWDGLTMRAGAPTAAATRLEQRNRLQSLKRKLSKTRTTDAKAETAAASAHLAFEQARTALREHQAARAALQKRLDEARRTLEAAEREAAAETLRVETLSDRLAQLAADAADARAAIASAEDMRSALASADPLRPELEAIAKTRDVAREKAGEIAAALAGLESEVQQLAQQTKSMTADQNRWTERAAAAGRRIAELNGRATSVAEQLTDASTLPDQLRARAETLAGQVSAAETERQRSADALAIAETELRDAQTTLRAAQTSVGEAREAKARDETRLEAARAALIDAANDIRQTLDAEPEMARARAGWDPDKTPDAELPDLESTTAKLQKMRSDRDRLGGVNLQAAEELDALEAEFTTRDAERADVEAAIAKLRGGIGQLNREARKRLLTAFESVNRQFATLFETLFGGGEARLALVDAEDPLEGGLEIIAKPPGKKPTTLSLLSGGEQTLTALALIFAVFLTNPSPICVLDEVDAPLDDANVERFCTLMEDMTERTETRFLVITHHPMTMARMNRLFGVTMAERGVSQLVSVDLEGAERFLEAS